MMRNRELEELLDNIMFTLEDWQIYTQWPEELEVVEKFLENQLEISMDDSCRRQALYKVIVNEIVKYWLAGEDKYQRNLMRRIRRELKKVKYI